MRIFPGSTSLFNHSCLVAVAFAICTIIPSLAQAQFVDDFERSDGQALGNGWVEKNPAAFVLAGGVAEKQTTGTYYRDNIVYRPAAENLLDVEASIEFRLTNAVPGYPQIFTRVQTDVSAFANNIDGYILYIDNAVGQAMLGRQVGASFLTRLASISLSQALNTVDNFRMRLRATGTSPVELAAFIERWNGTGWDIIGQATVSDNSADRFDVPGSVGFGGHVTANYVFDQFVRTNLSTGANPVPQLTSLNPNSTTEGGAGFTLTVDGSNFVPGAVVRWNGGDRATTYISANQLQAAITAGDIAAAGSASVTVFNPAPGGGTSGAQTFTIDPDTGTNPVPVLASLNPDSATEGGAAFTLTVDGSDFVPGAVVRWDGADRATTFISANQLQAAITAGDIAAAGSASVTVFNPAPGGGTSGAQIFTIDPDAGTNPVPVLASINPDSATEGGSGFTLTVDGSDFVPGAAVRWDGADRATTFISANQLQAAITAADIAEAGAASVTVFNPAPGGGVSGAQTFTINLSGGGTNPVPQIGDIFPESRVAGSGSFQLTVIGSGFVDQSTVNWDGVSRQTTYVSSQELQIQVDAADIAAAATHAITVSSPAPGGGGSAPHPFLATPQGSAYFLDNFNSADSPNIGNNWTEKNAAAFSLANNEVVGIETGLVYRDNIIYRPQAEDVTDAELSVEFVRQDAYGFAQLHARAQRNSITTPDTLESYILFINDFATPNSALSFAIGPPQAGVNECVIDEVAFPQALINGARYRLTFRVTGSNPVTMYGALERFIGGQWQPFVERTVVHDDDTQVGQFYCGPGVMPPPLPNGGAVGLSKWANAPDNYDNFYWIDLGGVAAEPMLSALNPSFREEGSGAFILTASGEGFNPASVVRWNGEDRSTVYVDATTLQADIPASDLNAQGTATITVFTPAPGGGTSNSLNFDIIEAGSQSNPVPTVSNALPGAITEGSSDTTITIDGAGFVAASVVRWNGVNLPSTFVSSSQLTAVVPASNLGTVGTAAVVVSSPAPGGGISEPVSVSVVSASEFFDDFYRPDSPNPGLGWTEKAPQSYTLQGASLVKLASGVPYRDNVVYRPAGESTLDVEASIELNLSDPTPGYPQLFTRLQSATVANPGVLDGYIFYLNNSGNQAILGRQTGSSFVSQLAAISLSEVLNTTSTYRLRMTANGSTPVVLSAFVERLTSTGFVTIGTATVNDSAPNRISNPGVSAIGGHTGAAYTFDNFRSRPSN